jgi:CBS domain-containing protein
MKVEEVMTPLVVSIDVDAPVAAAAQVMHTNAVGFLPVRDGGRLVGTVTDRDIAVRAATLNLDLEQTRVKEVMTPSVVTVSATADTVEALAVMEQAGVSRLLVVGAEDRVVGVLSTHDLPQVPPR